MRYKTAIMLAVGCVSLPVASAPALCQPVQPQSRAERIAAAEKPVLGWPVLVKEARRYIGTNPTDRKRLWCATFMNFILAKAGYAGTHSDAAKSFAYYGRRVSEPRIGAIAVLSRGRRGGHVGVVSGVDAHGNPVIISGNHNRRVGEAVYPRSRVIAYVMPTQGRRSNERLAAHHSPVRADAEGGIDSPIAELIAAIEAGQDRAERPARLTPPPSPPVPHRLVRQMPAQTVPAPVPHRLVQQMPEPMAPAAQPDLTLDRAFEFLGIKDHDRHKPPQRQRRVERETGRLASANGLAGLFGLTR
jgi:uncharacterized protein (TIGR02594 family)